MSFSLAAMMSADPRLDRVRRDLQRPALGLRAAKASSAAAARAAAPSGHHHALMSPIA
jgi:hypothetical protein